MGVLILDEPFTIWVLAGASLVIAGIYIFSRSKA
jgi:drug/metabolite transporter (DMT)-like permease